MARTTIRPLAVLALALLLPAAGGAQVDTGAADFSRYVALGDSLTAGFMSGSLIREAQRNSYPSLVYQQVNGRAAGFEQPLVGHPGAPGVLVLRSLAPLVIGPEPGTGDPLNLLLQRPYDNLAVPGFRVADVIETVTGNPIIDLVLRGLGTQLEQAVFLQPTFATLWIGNNDALGAATTGIVLDGVTLTPLADFRADFSRIAGVLSGFGVQWAAATVPSVTSIPFVTTIPPVVVDPGTGQPVVIDGQPVFLLGTRGDGTAGPLGPDDFVLLTASPLLAQGFGIPAALGGNGQPLPNGVVLDADEAEVIGERVGAYNEHIRAVADLAGAGLVDANAIFAAIVADGFQLGGIGYGADFLTGGLFSYDGVHPAPLGYAIVANAFIEEINRTFGAAIQPVDLGRFVFGDEGRLPGTGVGVPVAGEPFVFSRRAWRNLRKALRIPGPRQLRRAARLAANRGGRAIVRPPATLRTKVVRVTTVRPSGR